MNEQTVIISPLSEPRPTARNFLVALVGNPNTGKTTLFNALTGLRAKTANFPGTTVERKIGKFSINHHAIELVDLPGIYSLNAVTPEEHVACDVLGGRATKKPDAVVIIVDATNLERNLFLASQVMEQAIPMVIALNMMDIAEHEGIRIDVPKLEKELGCPIIPIAARTGAGIEKLCERLDQFLTNLPQVPPIAFTTPGCATGCAGCPFQARYAWTEEVAGRCTHTPPFARNRKTEKIDKWLTHPVIGIFAFFAVMTTLFFLIFQVATVPMDIIDFIFAHVGSFVADHLPDNAFRSLLVNGIIAGVGGILIFLPQICILFLFLALLEDTGYLARAAFVMDKLMRKIGLPGKAFVPLLSAHACALPAIMATRVIEDRRDRLVTILIAPLMTCSARIPVYAMVTSLLFSHQPLKAALVFTGAYGLGIVAALCMAFLFKKTILKGESKPLVIELPHYRIPSLRTALLHMYDRAKIFVQQAGTAILVISVILWVLATYPRSEPPQQAIELQQQAEVLNQEGRVDESKALTQQADELTANHSLAHSIAGRMGRWIEPVIAPLGFNWQIGIGIISSFAAREVIVSTLAVVYGVGSEQAEEEPDSLYDSLRNARRADGTAVFTTATCLSLLVFYILAAQCLPTQAVTRRETNSWKWPLFQIFYMTTLAYVGSLLTYQLLRAFGVS